MFFFKQHNNYLRNKYLAGFEYYFYYFLKKFNLRISFFQKKTIHWLGT